MNKKKLSIRWKITILSYILVIFSFLIGGIVLIGNIQHTEERAEKTADEYGSDGVGDDRSERGIIAKRTNRSRPSCG